MLLNQIQAVFFITERKKKKMRECVSERNTKAMFTMCDENYLFYTEFAVCKQLFGCRSILVPKPFASHADSDTASNKQQ